MKKELFQALKVVLSPYRARIFPLISRFPNFCLNFESYKRVLFSHFFKQMRGIDSYSIVCACYNVEKYIDYFIESIVYQTLDFEKNIQLILVDDGSNDSTLNKLKGWEKRYHDNIVILNQEHKGVSAARNLGLKCVRNKWVAFMDPDDFIDMNCLRKIDNFLRDNTNNKIVLISLNILSFYEKVKGFYDDHPLAYKFRHGNVQIPIKQLKDFIQLSVSSAFFRSEIIKERNLTFDSKCYPTFEDGLFVNSYLMHCFEKGEVVFLKDSIYYHRVPRDGRSLSASSWADKAKYLNVLKNGVLPLLGKWKSSVGFIPEFIQRASLYICYDYFINLLNHPEKCYFLSRDEKDSFLADLEKCLENINKEIIISSTHLSIYWKIAILGFMKCSSTIKHSVNIERYDSHNNQALLHYVVPSIESECITFGKSGAKIVASKVSNDTFLERPLVRHVIKWISLPKNDESSLYVSINGAESNIYIGKRAFRTVSVKQIKKAFFSHSRLIIKNPYGGCWLFLDRDIGADDNAEHLYRYIKNNHPERNIYFLLNKDSKDWDRLSKEGFRLIPLGSLRHRLALYFCSKLISSHADKYVYNFFNKKNIPVFVFLQHGITKDNLANWLNTVPISLMVTATPQETASILKDNSPYYLTNKEVRMLGFPRHDRLLRLNNPQKTIVIAPTWRSSLMGEVLIGNQRLNNEHFKETKFLKTWRHLLNSQKLKEITEANGYNVVFAPHPNLRSYIPDFDVPNFVTIYGNNAQRSIQELFAKASILITDYSSVAFEMAYLEKCVIYYQFDYEDILLKGQHIYQKGYFDYQRDGFGPVVKTETELLMELFKCIQSGCKVSEEIMKRINKTFVLRDGVNCKRCYEAIRDL